MSYLINIWQYIRRLFCDMLPRQTIEERWSPILDDDEVYIPIRPACPRCGSNKIGSEPRQTCDYEGGPMYDLYWFVCESCGERFKDGALPR